MPIPDFVAHLRERVGHDLLPLVGVTGVIRNPAGEILLARRIDSGEWAPPSGIVEPFEPPARALAREVREETGLTVSVDALVAVDTSDLIVYPNGDQTYYVQLIFACTPIAGTARVADDENDAIGWFDPQAFPALTSAWRARVEHGLRYCGTTWFAGSGIRPDWPGADPQSVP